MEIMLEILCFHGKICVAKILIKNYNPAEECNRQSRDAATISFARYGKMIRKKP